MTCPYCGQDRLPYGKRHTIIGCREFMRARIETLEAEVAALHEQTDEFKRGGSVMTPAFVRRMARQLRSASPAITQREIGDILGYERSWVSKALAEGEGEVRGVG